jgi:phosphate-selective porin OprO and OprP
MWCEPDRWLAFVEKEERCYMQVRSSTLFFLAVAAASVVFTGAAAAQQAQPAPPPAITAGWNDGFIIQSADGNNRLQIGAILQADGRFSLDEPETIVDTFVLRKARPVLSGRIAKYFDFKLMPELAGGTSNMLDAYFDVRISNAFRLRSGKDKTPVGYELLLGDTTLIFPERSLVSLLVPNRDVGFQAIGEVAAGRIQYGGGIFNGNVLDGTSGTLDVDANEGKDLAGRVVYLPFRATKGSAWGNLGFHLGASTGNQSGALPSFRTSAGQAFFSFSNTTADGRRSRVTPAVFLYYKRFGGFAEYARTQLDILRNDVPLTVANHAWGVTGSYVFTGEPTSDRGVRPRAPFDPAAGSWGALQVAARFSELTLDPDIIATGGATAGASPKARQFTVGANWFLNNFVKVYATYERHMFTGTRADENVIIFRSQFAF